MSDYIGIVLETTVTISNGNSDYYTDLTSSPLSEGSLCPLSSKPPFTFCTPSLTKEGDICNSLVSSSSAEELFDYYHSTSVKFNEDVCEPDAAVQACTASSLQICETGEFTMKQSRSSASGTRNNAKIVYLRTHRRGQPQAFIVSTASKLRTSEAGRTINAPRRFAPRGSL